MCSYRDNIDRLRNIAMENGWTFNPDYQWVKHVVGRMADGFDRYGDYYCPLKQVGDPPMVGGDVLCPCPEAAHEIAEYGHCFCRLFYAMEGAGSAALGAQGKYRMPLILS